MTKMSRFNTKAAKLTPSQVYELREKYANGDSQGKLAREYQVSVGQIGRIVRGESWQQYTNPAEIAQGARESEQRMQQIMSRGEPTDEEIQASFEKLQRMLAEDVGTKVKSDLDEFLTDPKVRGEKDED